mgnify:CR=1 FL=1
MPATGSSGFPATFSMCACALARAYGDFLENLSNLSRFLFWGTKSQWNPDVAARQVWAANLPRTVATGRGRTR